VDHLSTEQMRPFGLSHAQFDVLAQVGAAEGRSQGELAKALLVTKGNICQLLDRMERDGLLRRQQEGRTNRLFLTERGRLLRDQAVPAQEALIARLFSVLTHEEQVHLLGALRVLDHSLMDDQHTGDSPMSAPTESQTTKSTTWQIDAAHSLVEFAVKHMVFTTVKGRFSTVSGTIIEDTQDFSRSQVNVEIAADSITTGEPQRDTHLKSPDFFDAAQFPTLTFKSTSVKVTSDEDFSLVGDLTIHGLTHSVTLKAQRTGTGTNPYGKVVSGFSAETAISRKEFGLNWNVALEAGGVLVSDNIKISLDIQAVKQD
jgi:polyisoprenoid-binding protein YceI